MRRAFMPRTRGRGRRFRHGSYTPEQIEAMQALPAHERPAPADSHGMSVSLEQAELEARDPGTGAWIVPTQALEGLAAFMRIAPVRRSGEGEGARRHALVHAIMREEKRLARCARADRWKRPGEDEEGGEDG